MRSIRWIHAWVMALTLAVLCVLTLSDSVIGPLRRMAGLGLRLVRRVEAGSGFDLFSRPDLPVESDTLGHFLAWAVVGLIAAGLARGLPARAYLFLGLLLFSAFLEMAQGYLSWSRTPELTDLTANGVGLALGFASYWLLAAIFGPVMTVLTGRSGHGIAGRTATES